LIVWCWWFGRVLLVYYRTLILICQWSSHLTCRREIVLLLIILFLVWSSGFNWPNIWWRRHHTGSSLFCVKSIYLRSNLRCHSWTGIVYTFSFSISWCIIDSGCGNRSIITGSIGIFRCIRDSWWFWNILRPCRLNLLRLNRMLHLLKLWFVLFYIYIVWIQRFRYILLKLTSSLLRCLHLYQRWFIYNTIFIRIRLISWIIRLI
jgi:hypothetical protein